MRITKIKPQKNKKRVNIYLDGKFGFGLDADNFLKSGLKSGQKLTERQAQDLILKNEFQKLYDKTLRLIGARPRSEKEIRDYLKKKIWKLQKNKLEVKKELVDKVIRALKKQKLVDDYAFGVWWLEQRASFRPRGKIGLRAELRQKGVSEEIVDEVLAKVDELELAKKAIVKKTRLYKHLEPQVRRQKLSAFLARQGFSWETIKRTLKELKPS